MNVFSACATLALESSGTGEDFSSEIQQGLEFLRRIGLYNIIAEHGIRVLEDLLEGTHDAAYTTF